MARITKRPVEHDNPPGYAERAPGRIRIQVPDENAQSRWLCLDRPETVFCVRRHGDVIPALTEIGRAAERGYVAAGFISYEAAPAFDTAMAAHDPGALPLLWFGLYRAAEPVPAPALSNRPFTNPEWRPSVTREEYRHTIAEIKERIAAGETYQVNYSFRLRAPFTGDPPSFFDALCRSQRASYAAYLDTGEDILCSASPELFFRLDGRSVTCRPMKGTAARGLTRETDEARGRHLHHSAKNRAENLMIVDMIRNDLGRVARTGTIRVPRLFEVERYETILQMTSTITAVTDAAPADILRALFPCASITGAPKIRTMRIIRDLEASPRGIYTGCIGFVGPGRRAQFNVAIRTVHVDKASGQAEYGTGGGIVWDSEPEAEYRECETKARVLRIERPSFSLLETILWEPGSGYFLADRHLDRLIDSARYFDFKASRDAVAGHLARSARRFEAQPQRVRLLVAEDGTVQVESISLANTPIPDRLRVKLARHPVSRSNRFLYHKTTHRTVYEEALKHQPDCDDVILWNEEGEITESTIANIVVRKEGRWITPSLSSGVLPGVLRAHLLEQGDIREEVVRREDLTDATEVWLINSVRGWMKADVAG